MGLHRVTLTTTALAVAALVLGPGVAAGQDPQVPVSTPADCGPGSAPETDLQGRVPLADHLSGRADEPYLCNAEVVASLPSGGGYKVLRHVDAQGQECLFYDSTLVFPFDAVDPRRDSGGVFVVDLDDPSDPRIVDELLSPAMLSPHESLVLNTERGLLAAVLGNPATFPGIVDVYDVDTDCRSPELLSSSPVGFLGHESGFSPDGMTFYSSSLFSGTIAAVDLADPRDPQMLGIFGHSSHGLTLNEAGDRAYLAALTGTGEGGGDSGLIVLDTTEIRDRVDDPQVSVVSTLTWPESSIPQVAIPVTIDGRAYLVEIDEFAGHPLPAGGLDPSAQVGAGRIIDIEDDTAPAVVSNLRLEVHDPEARAGESRNDPGAQFVGRGYAGHYCAVPRTVDPQIVACSMIVSGLRVFDIRDPQAPREIAYANMPGDPVLIDPFDALFGAAYAMSAPAFVPERGEIWYSDVASGLHGVRLTNDVWDPQATRTPADDPTPDPARDEPADGGATDPEPPVATALPVSAEPTARPLPVTGATGGVALGLLAVLGAAAIGRRRVG